jgi:hypothetical protein
MDFADKEIHPVVIQKYDFHRKSDFQNSQSSQYNMHLQGTRTNSDMPLFRGPTCFNSWTTTQKTMQMNDKPLRGWVIIPLPQKKLLCISVSL